MAVEVGPGPRGGITSHSRANRLGCLGLEMMDAIERVIEIEKWVRTTHLEMTPLTVR